MSEPNRIIERAVYPKHFNATNSSRWLTVPLEQAVKWEKQLGHFLTTVYIQLGVDLTLSALPYPEGFYLTRHVDSTRFKDGRLTPTQFRVAIPIDWIEFHERNGRKIISLLMELSETLKVTPVLTNPHSTLSTLDKNEFLSNRKKAIIMTDKTLRRLTSMNNDVVPACQKCEKQLDVGQAVILIPTNRKTPDRLHTRYYHCQCYEKCFI